MCKNQYDVLSWTPLTDYPGMVQLGHMVDLALVFEEILSQLSLLTGLADIGSKNVPLCVCPH